MVAVHVIVDRNSGDRAAPRQLWHAGQFLHSTRTVKTFDLSSNDQTHIESTMVVVHVALP
jgi:hypothetical protein